MEGLRQLFDWINSRLRTEMVDNGRSLEMAVKIVSEGLNSADRHLIARYHIERRARIFEEIGQKVSVMLADTISDEVAPS